MNWKNSNSALIIFLMVSIVLSSCEQKPNNPTKEPVKEGEKAIEEVVKNETADYQLIEGNKYYWSIEKMEGKELAELLDIEIRENRLYNGSTKYIKNEAGNFVLNGTFNLVSGNDYIAGTESRDLVTYTGIFKQGKKQGLFVEEVGGYESDVATTIFYENDKCVWGYAAMSAEGEETKTDRMQNPKNCSFTLVADDLF